MTVQLAGLDPEVRERAELCMSYAAQLKLPVTITSTTRSWANQTQLRTQYEACVNRGETITPGNPNPACRYPANRPGDSAHNFGLAWDSWVPDEEWGHGISNWELWNAIRRWAGFSVPEHDRIHAEVPSWRNFATAIKRG